jgi:hypothetical protein
LALRGFKGVTLYRARIGDQACNGKPVDTSALLEGAKYLQMSFSWSLSLS